jgi:hypothetical protein
MTLNPSSPVTGSSLPFTIVVNSIKKSHNNSLEAWGFSVDYFTIYFSVQKPFFFY